MFLLMYGCKAYDPQLIADEYKYDTTELAKSYHIYENKPDEIALSRLKSKPYHVVLEKHISQSNSNNPIFDIITIGTLFTSGLVGIPSYTITATCNMEASIFSENNNQIKTLVAKEQDREFVAAYYGYNMQNAPKVARDIACYKARNELFKQLETISLDEIKDLNKKDKVKIEKEKAEQTKKQQQKIAERKKHLTEKYGEETADTIMRHKIIRGMSESALKESWGNPVREGTSVDNNGTRKQYIYINSNGYSRVYIENGIVKGWDSVK